MRQWGSESTFLRFRLNVSWDSERANVFRWGRFSMILIIILENHFNDLSRGFQKVQILEMFSYIRWKSSIPDHVYICILVFLQKFARFESQENWLWISRRSTLNLKKIGSESQEDWVWISRFLLWNAGLLFKEKFICVRWDLVWLYLVSSIRPLRGVEGRGGRRSYVCF